MYLLKLISSLVSLCLYNIFTFHYVSIKTIYQALRVTFLSGFTFHYVSIKTDFSSVQIVFICYLHSTMYLLKLSGIPTACLTNGFTFHYVSIKTHGLKWPYFDILIYTFLSTPIIYIYYYPKDFIQQLQISDKTYIVDLMVILHHYHSTDKIAQYIYNFIL